MANDPIPFRPRRTLSRYADDKAVKDFARVAELIDNPHPTKETIEELARLLRQSAPPFPNKK